MHWIQNEKPIEYHVVRWENSAFHNHDKVDKRKLLGGVSFDGGGAGGGGNGSASQGTGVQSLQPSFLDGYGLEIGNGSAGLMGDEKTGGSLPGTERSDKDTVSIRSVQESAPHTEDVGILAASQVIPAQEAVQINETTGNTESERTRHRSRFDHQKYIRKMQNGIQAFLQSMRQRSGKEQRKQTAKKEIKGTRPVTKEDVYEIRMNTAYLLDSYNKHGERSTLGKE